MADSEADHSGLLPIPLDPLAEVVTDAAEFISVSSNSPTHLPTTANNWILPGEGLASAQVSAVNPIPGNRVWHNKSTSLGKNSDVRRDQENWTVRPATDLLCPSVQILKEGCGGSV